MWSVRITPGGAGSRPSLSVAPVSSLTLSPPRGCGASAQPRTRYLSAPSPLEGDRVDVGGVIVAEEGQGVHGGAPGASGFASPGWMGSKGWQISAVDMTCAVRMSVQRGFDATTRLYVRFSCGPRDSGTGSSPREGAGDVVGAGSREGWV